MRGDCVNSSITILIVHVGIFCKGLQPSMHTQFFYMSVNCGFSPDASTMILFVGDPFWLLLKIMVGIGCLVLPPRWMMDRLSGHFFIAQSKRCLLMLNWYWFTVNGKKRKLMNKRENCYLSMTHTTNCTISSHQPLCVCSLYILVSPFVCLLAHLITFSEVSEKFT